MKWNTEASSEENGDMLEQDSNSKTESFKKISVDTKELGF